MTLLFIVLIALGALGLALAGAARKRGEEGRAKMISIAALVLMVAAIVVAGINIGRMMQDHDDALPSSTVRP